MEAHSPPTKIARLTDTGLLMGKQKSPPSVKLNLGLGCSDNTSTSSSSHGRSTGFTFLQLQEFQHQALIYKHMSVGVPVPFNLILPIWKSLASSYGTLHSAPFGDFPTYLGCKGGIYFDYRNSMEPEPGRCRRTDGKKWRCSKDVVPNQKYCERHMHRGRNRSRKPVEITTSQIASSSNANIHINDSNTNLSISRPPHLTTTTTTTNTNNNLRFSPKSVIQSGGISKRETTV